jgi:hypothetical protein
MSRGTGLTSKLPSEYHAFVSSDRYQVKGVGSVAKGIRTRVNESFNSDDKDSLKYILDSLTVSWKDHADGIRRSGILMIVLIALFELLVRGLVKQVTLGPLVLSSTTTITIFVPTVIAYFYYESFRYGMAFEDAVNAYAQVLKMWNSAAEENDLWTILIPRTPAFWPAVSASEISYGGRIEGTIGITVGVVTIFGILGFEGYAFYQLYNVPQVIHPLLWINAVLTALLLLATLVQWLTWSDGHRK